MKKLLLVLLVVALASFLFVGCLPTTPAEGEGEGEGEGEVGICPTVAVTSQVAVGGKNYIKAGSQTITVTFAVPTEPVSVYVGSGLKTLPSTGAEEVVMYTTDKLVYTGTFSFGTDETGEVLDNPCGEAYIYVSTCETCDYCKFPYTVDAVGPKSEIVIASVACADVCDPDGKCTLTFKTPKAASTCADVCCGDVCSGFASYNIDLYTSDPFDDCCDVPCVTPAYSCTTGTVCPIDCTLTCITGTKTATDKVYYMVASLLDAVGNRTRYYAKLTLDSACGLTVEEFSENVSIGGVPTCTDFETDGIVQEDKTIGGCLPAAI
ncbi:MAG: hypothetical protein DRH33_08110 [Candidatus Nealsonbacteria bacterium]|nr:MAG: hypothetical protein DRH33_08110 [Candidatus Nealsonbacteria bacterium]